MKLFLPLLALALPTAAPAVCPTARDLDTGILFRTLDGDTELFRRVSDNVVQSVYTSGSEESRVLLGQGLYVLDNVALVDGEVLPDTQVQFSYPVPVAEMPLPQPEGGWSVDVTVEEAGYSEPEEQTYAFGPMTEIGVGNCTFDMIPVIQTYSPDPYEVTDYVNWLPELGVSYLVQSSHAHGEDRYRFVSVEAVR
ncbi:hypothetical protein KUV62_09835 [Salipiger bermudensis]|uniref:hypothetical protein n=1 Tax=Salipiger bermudensis TaxID=344736 RepID=UPI001C994C6E|nr:hypothetical protein [Salipiger bermudensis]MBY6004209.1 hypothetical protein [Salipiger bermudensis]